MKYLYVNLPKGLHRLFEWRLELIQCELEHLDRILRIIKDINRNSEAELANERSAEDQNRF
jgi:hypothetical protein